MVQVFVRHKVQDFNKWKPHFDEHAAARDAGGCAGGRLFRGAGDPNEVAVLFEWEDRDKAQQFIESNGLRQAMERAGVVSKPEIYFLEEVERFAK